MPPKSKNQKKAKLIKKVPPGRNQSGVKAQSVAQVTRKLANMTTVKAGPDMAQSSLYINCRLNPFNANGSNGLPDSSKSKRIVVDHRNYTDIVIGVSGTFVIKTLPSVGLPFVIKSGANSSLTVSGTSVQFGTDGAVLSSNWYPCRPYAEWTPWIAASPNLSVSTVDPFGSAKFRIITQALRIYYTGPINSCSGILTINSDPIQIDPSNRPNNTALNALTYTAGVQGTGTFAINSFMTNRLACNTNLTTIASNTIMMRPEAGATILIPHLDETYNWVPMPDYGVIFEAANNIGNVFMAIDATQGYSGSVPPIDPGWDSMLISGSGFATGTGLRVECITCVEYVPNLSSAFLKLAKEPVENLPVMHAAEVVAKQMPLAQTLANDKSAGFVRKALAMVGKVAPIMGSAFGPVGATVGSAVGSIAQVLA